MENYKITIIIKLLQVILPLLGTSWHDQGLPKYKNNKNYMTLYKKIKLLLIYVLIFIF